MTNRDNFCIANWKMYIDNQTIKDFFNKFLAYDFNNNAEIIFCPTFLDLLEVSKLVDGHFNISVGSQDVSNFSEGAYTGQISPQMLINVNCSYCIIGHSERRLYNNETDEIINQKLRLLNETNINPIICIGETIEERNEKKTFEVLINQVEAIFNDVTLYDHKKYILAYEPRWAIGTGVSADIDTIASVHKHIKNIIKTINDKYCNLYLVYGGSVDELNASAILNIEDVDGLLIGSAAISPVDFYNIYNKF
tara:strand:+ start:111 stop:863 length:753 start_codon:yes stop_codon:yes gene_type:complete